MINYLKNKTIKMEKLNKDELFLLAINLSFPDLLNIC